MPRQDWEVQGADEIKARLQKILLEAEEPEETEEAEEAEEPSPESQEITVAVEEFVGKEDEDLAQRLKSILAEETDDEEDPED